MSRVDRQKVERLYQEYRKAPKEYQATSYWTAYEEPLLETLLELDLEQLRSGRYSALATFGFHDQKYFYHPNQPFWMTTLLKFIQGYLIKDRAILPYDMSTKHIRDIAYRHCELAGSLAGSRPISDLEVSTFGAPADLFEVGGRKYTMSFLGYYLRYCFVNQHMRLRGDEILVELGSGSGYQVEVLKKLYPNLTVICFDLPAQIYLCEAYLREALGSDVIVGTDSTLEWSDLSSITPGRVHLLGNWQMPMLREFQFDLFWNAASFGEMEPDVVENYLSIVKRSANWVYLLQARHGKETAGKNRVQSRIDFASYRRLLSGYNLCEERPAWVAHRRLSDSGGYFEAIWKTSKESRETEI
jgi:putative sugar O-methyltransferase